MRHLSRRSLSEEDAAAEPGSASPDAVDVRDTTVRAALFLVGFSLYAATATPGAFLLDSSELTAAGVTLGVPHAPGHPLYVILAYACSLLPVGAVGFRVALLSGLFGAMSVVLTYDLARLLSRGPGGLPQQRWPAAAGALVFAVAGALWLQSVRGEVYTLHLAIALWLTRLALRWSHTTGPRSSAPPLVAAFVTGLAAGNHTLLLAAHVPALVILLAPDRAARAALPRRVAAMLPAGLIGLCIYALLPLRAATHPVINYGDPSTLARFVDVVLARVFVGSVSGASTPLGDNLAGAAGMFLDSLGPVAVLGGIAGLVVLIRRKQRLLAAAVVAGVVGNLATKVTMDLDPTNPDAAGYFLTSMALVVALAVVAIDALSGLRGPRSRQLAVACAALMTLSAAVGIDFDRVDLRRHRAPAILDTALAGSAAPDSLALTSFFALHFDRLHGIGVAGVRPDVFPMHQGMEDHIEGGRPYAAASVARDPTLAPLLDSKQADGSFPTMAVLEHAGRRPVYLEPTFGLPIDPAHLEYAGGWFRVVPRGAQPRALHAEQAADQAALMAALGAEAAGQRETRTTLMLLWLQVAVVRVQQGDARGADLALELVAALGRGQRYVDRLLRFTAALRDSEADGHRHERVTAAIAATDFAAVVLGGAPAPL